MSGRHRNTIALPLELELVLCCLLAYIRVYAHWGDTVSAISTLLNACSEATKYIIRSRLRATLICLVFIRILVKSILKLVKCKFLEVLSCSIFVSDALFVETLNVIDCWDEVKVDFGQNVAICVILDVLQAELFKHCLLAVKVTNLCL